jgi:hypothetical protein
MFKVGDIVRVRPFILPLLPRPRGIGVVLATSSVVDSNEAQNLLIYWARSGKIQLEFDGTIEKCSK